ncbi:hypothetical protein TPHA_0F02150 [Tetrapisispora phaffii CBS 4417]|uniref:Serine/threonine-protein kinase CBK1 n=1 Tax=Tetrapisispora phaffii (strain ATCC 24235 / CBS 4417 / NBRC 1672 / NRRL Y-8282 / UCD 70-5) TaxID=1071381 RepID=G8BVB5_TETPH|nr:hypothetical protein TPHA_0F02150 [Tetrapisispora phaffii CBS 4417]CCE63697.1 hypothetical protein TPHA_0F02150 [Tetrapisispora phaffii CBS 4417]
MFNGQYNSQAGNEHEYYQQQQQQHMQRQQQQQQQQQQQDNADRYQQLQRPPNATFSENYMRAQNSHQSLQSNLQNEQQQQQQQQQQQHTGGINAYHDNLSLDFPSTPPPAQNGYIPNQHNSGRQNSNSSMQQPIAPQQLVYNSSEGSNHSTADLHSTNSFAMLQQQQQQQAFSPGQYTAESEYGQHSPLYNSNNASASSPLAQPQQLYNDSHYQSSPITSILSSNSEKNTQNMQNQQIQYQDNILSPSRKQNQANINSSNYMYFERRPDLLTKSTQDKAAAVKLRIENFYQSSVKYAIERNQRRVELETELASHDWSDERKSRQLTSLGKKESQFLRLRRTRLSLEDFQTVKVIGKGAFGEVRLVQKVDTGKIYAMKTLLKSEMYKKDQLAHVKAERDVLAGSDSPWVVSLYYSFQDAQYLYLIMEFLPGGDLMTMLIRWQIFTEDVTRFYIAECILAIEAIHKLGFIHRDIKPDNILIDIRGHIKLSDFGLSTGFHKTHDSNYYKKLLQEDETTTHLDKPGQPNVTDNNRQSMFVDSINLTMSNRQQIQTWRKSRRLMAYSTVGTPDYIAPEIFLYQGYGQECDWWSLGAIMYECLIGWPPFCSETPQETYRKIMNFEQTLQFPDDIHISYEAEDLIRRLLTHSDNRLGRHGGAAELKSHPFFSGVDWNAIRQVDAPYIPKLSSITDTRFFPTDELENVPDSPAMAQAAMQREQMLKNGAVVQASAKEDLPFIGYTYSRFDYLTRKNAL